MSLTINGSGGGITASEVVALTGWNTIASFQINTSGTITATASSTLCDVSSYEDAIKEFGEVRWRAEWTRLSLTGGNSASDYVSVCMNTTSSALAYYALGHVQSTMSAVTNFAARTVPFYVKLRTGAAVPSYTQYNTQYWYWYPSTGASNNSSNDVSVFNLLLRLGKASSTTGATYKVQGTFYLEGRY